MSVYMLDKKISFEDFDRLYSKINHDKIKKEYLEFKADEKKFQQRANIIKTLNDYLMCYSAVKGDFENNTFDLSKCIYVVADNAEKMHFNDWCSDNKPKEILTLDECNEEHLVGRTLPMQFSNLALRTLWYYAVAVGDFEGEFKPYYDILNSEE